VTGQRIRDGIVLGRDPLAVEVNVEQRRDEEGSLQYANRCSTDTSLVDGRNDRFVIAKNQQ
jgi:hypothetical protein